MSNEEKNTSIYIAFDELEPADSALPEKNLLRAILLTAMSDLKKPGDSHRRATEYFLSGEEDYLFSFRSICNFLDIDPLRILTVTGLGRNRNQAAAPVAAPAVASMDGEEAVALGAEAEKEAEVEVEKEGAVETLPPDVSAA